MKQSKVTITQDECWILDFNPLKALKIRQHKLNMWTFVLDLTLLQSVKVKDEGLQKEM
jgi:hypothetical protein